MKTEKAGLLGESPWRRLLWLGVLVALIWWGESPLFGQGDGVPNDLRTAVVIYASSGPGRPDGYENALIEVNYRLVSCSGNITIIMGRVRGSAVGSSRYWVDGVQIPASMPPPVAPPVLFSGRVMSGGVPVAEFAWEPTDPSGWNCYSGEIVIVGKVSDHLPPKYSAEEAREFIRGLHLVVNADPRPLRNAALENAYRTEQRRLAQERAKAEREAEMRRAEEERELQRYQEQEALRQAEEARRQAEESARRQNQFASGNFWGSGSSAADGGGSGVGSGGGGVPEFARSPEGGYYRRGGDGQFRQISETAFHTGLEEQRRAREAEAEAVRRREAEESFAGFEAEQRLRADRARQTHEAIDRRVEAFSRSFYAGQAVRDVRSNIEDLTNLRGDYATAEELEHDYRRRLQGLREEMRQLEAAERESIRASADLYFGDTDPAVGEFIGNLGTMISNHQREREQREARQRLEAQRQRQLGEIETRRQAMILELRRNLLAQFPDGGVPLSSHRVEGPEVYFFSYSLEPKTIEERSPVVSVSNTFAVHRRGDGTWPFRRIIDDEIRALAPGETTLMGYYATREMAESMRASFVRLAGESGFQVAEFDYNRPTSRGNGSAATSPKVDFWGGSTGEAANPPPRAAEPHDFWR